MKDKTIVELAGLLVVALGSLFATWQGLLTGDALGVLWGMILMYCFKNGYKAYNDNKQPK